MNQPPSMPSVKVFDSAIVPRSSPPEITVKDRNAETLQYRVRLFMDGPGLPFVKRVRYGLHSTFPNPNRMVERTVENPNCGLVIWTWGIFTVDVTVEDKQGNTFNIQHPLSYGSELAGNVVLTEEDRRVTPLY